MVRCFDNRKKPLGTASSRHRRRRPSHSLTVTTAAPPPPKVYWQSANGTTVLDAVASSVAAAPVHSTSFAAKGEENGAVTIEQTQQQMEVWKEDCRLKDAQIQKLQLQIVQLQQRHSHTKPNSNPAAKLEAALPTQQQLQSEINCQELPTLVQQQLVQSQQQQREHEPMVRKHEQRVLALQEQMAKIQQELNETKQQQLQQRLHQERSQQEWQQRESELLNQIQELQQVADRQCTRNNQNPQSIISPPTPARSSNRLSSKQDRRSETAFSRQQQLVAVKKQVLCQPSPTIAVRSKRRNSTIPTKRGHHRTTTNTTTTNTTTSWLSSLNRQQERWQRRDKPLTFCGQTLHLKRSLEIDSPSRLSSSSDSPTVDHDADMEEDI